MRYSLFLLAFIFASCSIFSQSLILNKHFGTNGIVTTNFGTDGGSYVSAIAVQKDGKIILGGNAVLTRVFPDGKPDSSFGVNGTCAFPDYYATVKVLIQSDGKIVAVNSGSGYTGFTRISVDGKIDYSYGSNGQCIVNTVNGESFFVSDCVMTVDDRILFLGTGDADLQGSLVISRLLPSGSVDSSFNGNGMVAITEPIINDRWSPGVIAVQSTGKIIVAGLLFKGLEETSINVLRFNSNGSADNNFNNTGRFTHLLDPSGGEANMAIQVQSNDGILLAGGDNGLIFAIKLLANGQADPVFNGNGIAISNALYGQPIDIFLRPNGKVLVAGMVSPDMNSDSDYGAVQFNANGTPDAGFGAAGGRIISVGDNDVVAGALLQADGSLVMFGDAWNIYVATMVKLTSAGNTDNSFGTAGIKMLQLVGSDDAIVTLIEQPDKKLLAGGWKTRGFLDSSNLVIVRYKADGKSFDSSFGVAGRTAPFDPALYFLSMALQSTGKIVLNALYYPGGDTSYTGTDLNIISRFNSNGTIDNSFGVAGRYVSTRMNSYIDPAAIKLLPDDRILLCHNQHIDDGMGIVLTRLLANGLPDNSFGVGGTVILATDNFKVQRVDLQPDGKIIIAAKQESNDSTTCFLVRLLANGSYDNGFDGDGIKKIAAVASLSDGGPGYGFTTDGKIVSPVSLFDTDLQKFVTTVYRFNIDGTPDLTFNKTGALTIPGNPFFSSLYSENCALDKDNNIYIIGEAHSVDADSTLSFIMLIKNTGVIDTTIDYTNNGIFFTQNIDVVLTVTVLSDSSLVLAGLQEQSDFRKEGDFFISKYRRLANGYRFTGNGNWSNPANWESGKVPPVILPAGSYVFIQPSAGGQCILDISQQISSDDNIVIAAGKNLIITGNLIIK